MVVDLASFLFVELMVAAHFDVHQVIVRFRGRADQLVEFELGGDLLAALRVLDNEHHDERGGGRDDRKAVCPSGSEIEEDERGKETDYECSDDD